MPSHKNAALTFAARRRLVERCKISPITQVAAEMGISRACASKWVNRWRRNGDAGLFDQSSTPHNQPTATAPEVVAQVEFMRRAHQWSASRIASELNATGTRVSRRTVTRLLAQLGLNRRSSVESGDTSRRAKTITAEGPVKSPA